MARQRVDGWMDRRRWLGAVVASSATAAVGHGTEPPRKERDFCAFIKFIQELSYERLAAKVAAMGYQGIEATVRKGGHVLPERVEQDLPRLVQALAKEGLEVTVMASDINDATDPLNRRVMAAAADVGVRRYRMKYYRYSLQQPVLRELDDFRRRAENLAAANRKLGLSAVYQNHAGAHYVGATVWDFLRLLKGIDPAEIGVAFDIRHATATAGASWEVLWNVVQPHLQMVYVKDFHWKRNGDKQSGRTGQVLRRQTAVNVPLGQGQVAPEFFRLLRNVQTPISVHVEYLRTSGLQRNLEALEIDLRKLKRLMMVGA